MHPDSASTAAHRASYAGGVFDLDAFDLDEIADALSDQTDYEHRWLVDPRTGEVVYWSSDCGIDGENPVDLDELDHIGIDPIPSYVWYEDMVDFVEGISDDNAGRRLGRALSGRGAFRRFRIELYEDHEELAPVWEAFRDVRARRRAVEWLADVHLIEHETADRFASEHPDPDLP